MISLVALASLCGLAMAQGGVRGDSPSISSTPSSFSGLTATLTVSWSYPSSMAADDCWVGVFSVPNPNTTALPTQPYPATPPFLGNAPAQFFLCSLNKTNPTMGSWNVDVVHGRNDLGVVLFTGGIKAPRELARTQVTATDKLMYVNAHVTPWEEKGEFMVVFFSGGMDDIVTVKWGLSADKLDNTVEAVTHTYGRQDLCNFPANSWGFHDPGFSHRALLQGVPVSATQPTKIYYEYGDAKMGFVSSSFIAPATGVEATVGICLIADLGVTIDNGAQDHWMEPAADQTIKGCASGINAGRLQALHHIGDVAYATGMEQKWDYYLAQLRSVTAVPISVNRGNHEEDSALPQSSTYYKSEDSGGECGMSTRFRLPQPEPADANGWFTTRTGPVTTVFWATEYENGPGSSQYDYLKATLAGINRTETPWVLVAGHRPIYTDVTRDEHLGLIEQLLMDYKVDFSFYGHVHNAQLFCPMFNNSQCLPDTPSTFTAPRHAVIGNAGQELSPFPKLDNRTLFSYEGYGWNEIIANATQLTLRFFADSNSSLLYEETVHKVYPRPYLT